MRNESKIKNDLKDYLNNNFLSDEQKVSKYYDGIMDVINDPNIVNEIYDEWIKVAESDDEEYNMMILYDMVEYEVFGGFFNKFTENLIKDGYILEDDHFKDINGNEHSGSSLFWEKLDYSSDVNENTGMNYEMWLER